MCIRDRLLLLQKNASRLRELLELTHVVEYLVSCSGEGSRRGRPRSVGGVGRGISWVGLWRSIVGYVRKEVEAISKLEEKGPGSISASTYTSRQTKKKVTKYCPQCVKGIQYVLSCLAVVSSLAARTWLRW